MAGGGLVSVGGANQKRESQAAFVTDHALWVRVVAGGAGGGVDPVRIHDGTEILAITPGNSAQIAITEQAVDVEVVQPTHDDLNCNANMQIGDVDVGGANPVPVSDNGGSLTVDFAQPVSVDDNGGSLTVDDGGLTISIDDGGGSLTIDGSVSILGQPIDIDIAAQTVDVEVVQPTHDDLNANATLQLQDVDIVAGGALGVARPQRIPVTEYGTANLPNIYYNILGLAELPGVGITDPSALRAASVNAPMMGGVGGSLKTGPDRDDITQLVNAQTFDNVTTNFQSALLAVAKARWLVIYLSIVVANAPTGILIEAEFSRDGGTNWFKWSVDQWVDLRYVPNQMPVLEAIPLNYVIGTDFRLNITAFGTTAVNTFTLSAWAEAVS